ncbi:MAG: galactose ABC transporter substrate-binding protein [Lawsonibacter sp.]
MIRTIKSCSSRSHPDRLISLVLTAALLLPMLTGCRSGGETEGKTLRIGVAMYTQDDTFISTIVQDLERMAQEEEGEKPFKINLSTADGRSNQTTQLDQVDRFLTRGCDVLCVNIVDRTAAAVIIDKAEEAGVPLVFFNRQPVAEDIQRWDRIYYVGARAEEGGTLQGQLVLNAWQSRQDELDRNGDGVLQYVMLEGEPGHQDALLRTEYSIKALTDAGVEVEKLVSDTANWNRGQAMAKMQRWLEEFGPEIEVVFANNDDMALGAIDAFHEAGAELPMVVGVDATAPALEAVKSGELYGTVLNDAQGIARAMLDLMLALTEGGDPADTMELEDGHYIWLPYQPVTQGNLNEFLEEYSP